MLLPTLIELMKHREQELIAQIACLSAQLGELQMWQSKEQAREDTRKLDREAATRMLLPSSPAAESIEKQP
jgi:hypothetical protein